MGAQSLQMGNFIPVKMRKIRPALTGKIDAIDLSNARCILARYNKEALESAKK